MSLYSTVNPGIKIYQNFENRGYEDIADIAFGDLIPIGHLLCMPGEYLHINNSAFVRTIPMFAPVFGNVKIRIYNFAVPIRILDENAANIIKGYDDDGVEVQGSLPGMYESSYNANNSAIPQWSFWDYMSWPTIKAQNLPQLAMPAKYWYQGYVKIWNEFFRDQNYQEEIDADDLLFDDDDKPTGGQILKVNFKKDYFTSATPELLKGEIPSLGLGGSAALDFSNVFPSLASQSAAGATSNQQLFVNFENIVSDPYYQNLGLSGTTMSNYEAGTPEVKERFQKLNDEIKKLFEKATVSGAGLGTFDVSKLRQLFAYTRIKERASRCGSRYTEYLRSNFGISPRDERMQRPEFLGGCSSPVIVNEVTQTSAATEDSAQGNLSGKGTSLVGSRQKGYLCTEFMLIYTLAAIVPDSLYSTGIDRTDTIKNRFDFPNPSFQNLSEQAVHGYELYAAGDLDASGDSLDEKIIGYQGRYNEFRRSQSHVTGSFRNSLNYWHLSREFAQRPFINSDFLEVNAATNNLNRIFNALDDNQYKPFYVHAYNGYKVKQPLVKIPSPGLIDHN